jgi:hypothetical protein
MTTRFRWVITVAAGLGGTAGALHAFVPFSPPACGGTLSDVAGQPCSWAEQLVADGIAAACAAGKYCPDNPVTRVQLAAMLERAMRGTSAWAPWQGVFRRIVLVQAVPGDPAASGLALSQAVTGISDASETNPYLVKVEPGTYQLAGELAVPAHVHIEGSGERITVITGDGGGPSGGGILPITALINGAQELRFLSVTSETTGHFYSTAVMNSGVLDHVTLTATGGTIDVGAFRSGLLSHVTETGDYGFFFSGSPGVAYESTVSGGVRCEFTSAELHDVKVSAGAVASFCNLTLNGGSVQGTYGVVVNSGTVRIDHSEIHGSTAALDGASFKVGASMIDGSVSTATAVCVGAYSATYAALNTTCN